MPEHVIKSGDVLIGIALNEKFNKKTKNPTHFNWVGFIYIDKIRKKVYNIIVVLIVILLV